MLTKGPFDRHFKQSHSSYHSFEQEARRQIDVLEEELIAKDQDLKACCNEVRMKDEEVL